MSAPQAAPRDTLRNFRRRVILDAARRLLAAQGADGASMRDIAAAAGCTTGAIYPLFAAKDDIFRALLAELRPALAQHLSAAMPASAAPGQRLKQGAMAWHDFFSARPAERALLRALADSETLADRENLADALRESCAPLADCIATLGNLSAAMAQRETAALLALLAGLLLLPHPGGNEQPAVILDHSLDALIARLQWE